MSYQMIAFHKMDSGLWENDYLLGKLERDTPYLINLQGALITGQLFKMVIASNSQRLRIYPDTLDSDPICEAR